MTFDARTAFPLLVLGATAVAVMLTIAMRRSHAAAAWVSALGLVLALAGLVARGLRGPGTPLTSLLIVDGFAVFGMGLIVLATLAVVLLSFHYLAPHAGWPEEYYVLLLVAALGATVLVASNHFASFFLGLELLSVSLYALIAFFPQQRRSLEAGLKYLVLAATTAAFLLFGMALVYAESGTLELDRMVAALLASDNPSFLLVPGMAFILVGVGFKLALVPFHMWTPDIYQGAPPPVAAFVATVSKGAVLLLLLRLLHATAPVMGGALHTVLAVLAVASMLVGNLLALLQQNVKRILAYSSIAHLGYLLVAFQAQGTMAASAASFYLVAYFVTMLGAFAVVTIQATRGRPADLVDDYRGLFWQRPWLAGAFTLMLLSLAGIPLTVGFIGKLQVLSAGAFAAAWAPVLVLVAASTVGFYYYLRIVVAMFEAAPDQEATRSRTPLPQALVLGSLTILLVWLGVYPDALLRMLGIAMASFGR